jgi:hypothetical protein
MRCRSVVRKLSWVQFVFWEILCFVVNSVQRDFDLSFPSTFNTTQRWISETPSVYTA